MKDDASGILILIAAHRHADNRHTRGERTNHGAMARMRVHCGRLPQQLAVRRRCAEVDVRRARNRCEVDGRSRRHDGANVELAKRTDDASQHIDLILEGRTETDQHEWTAVGGVERRSPRLRPRRIVQLGPGVDQLSRRIGGRKIERGACQDEMRGEPRQLIERMREWSESEHAPCVVERRGAFAKLAQRHCANDPVPQSAEDVRRRLQSGTKRRHARQRE